jgi:hypothetical protein
MSFQKAWLLFPDCGGALPFAPELFVSVVYVGTSVQGVNLLGTRSCVTESYMLVTCNCDHPHY